MKQRHIDNKKRVFFLETTGVTELVHTKTLLRNVSIDDRQIIGMGRSSTVYQIDSKTVIKIYDEHVPVELIRREMEQARRAYISGIPTAVPFGLVRADDSYGIVFERIIPGVTVGNAITEHAERFDEITLMVIGSDRAMIRRWKNRSSSVRPPKPSSAKRFRAGCVRTAICRCSLTNGQTWCVGKCVRDCF